MKINVFSDIASRKKIKEEYEKNKRDSKSKHKALKENKRGKTKRNKKNVSLLTDETGVHDEVRDSDRVSDADAG